MIEDLDRIRAAFPLLERSLAGRRITWLDSASTAPRLRCAMDAASEFGERYTANVHRGVHPFAAEASAAFEAVRHEVAVHLGAEPSEVVFTRGTTDAINLVANGLGLRADDEVLSTLAEHHANSLPWRARAKLRCVPSIDDGTPRWEQLADAIGSRTRLIAVHHASNVLGTLAPLHDILHAARARGVPVLVDGAQAAGHLPVNLEQIGCDYYAFSGHKLGAQAGIGALIARGGALDRLEPSTFGGGMVARVDLAHIELREGVHRFEAGTPNVEGVLGLGAALRHLRGIGMAAIAEHGRRLARALVAGCLAIPGVRLLGDPEADRIPLATLVLPQNTLDAETVARTLADTEGILLSAGRHCAHVLHDTCDASSTLRISAWLFNDLADVEHCLSALRSLIA